MFPAHVDELQSQLAYETAKAENAADTDTSKAHQEMKKHQAKNKGSYQELNKKT